MSNDDVKDTCTSYAKQTDGPFPHILKPIQKQGLQYLILWVKDQVRYQEDPECPNDMTQSQFKTALEASLTRYNMSK